MSLFELSSFLPHLHHLEINRFYPAHLSSWLTINANKSWAEHTAIDREVAQQSRQVYHEKKMAAEFFLSFILIPFFSIIFPTIVK